MPEHRDGKQPPLVVATTLPFFERAATIVDETRRDLERMAAVLNQCAEHLSADSSERAILELIASSDSRGIARCPVAELLAGVADELDECCVEVRQSLVTIAPLAGHRRHPGRTEPSLGVMTEFILRQPARPQDAQNALRIVLGVPAPPSLVPTFRDRFGCQMLEAYGMTEVNIPLYFPLDALPRDGSCGKVYHRYFAVRVVNPGTDEELPHGEIGEIVVRPREPFAFSLGYHAMPERTVEAWRNFWFHTGDAGRRDADGYFYFVDRIKDCIRRRGENISSYEIESVLTSHAAVAEAAAVAVKSEITGGEDEVKVCLVLKRGAQVTFEALADHCLPRMPAFAVPRYFELLDKLPRTPTEKIQKALLRATGVTPTTWDRLGKR
jgi:crotonobetaine/carnitine-CoA ligase